MVFGSQDSVGEVITTTRLLRLLTYKILIRRRRLTITKALRYQRNQLNYVLGT